MNEPNVIRIESAASQDVSAAGAEVQILVHSSSFADANRALEKTKEVASFVERLADAGVNAEAVRVQGVRTPSSESGSGSKSTVQYQLSVRCADLSAVVSVLRVTSSCKGAEVCGVRWQYDDAAAAMSTLLKSCLEESLARAHVAAQALGTKVVGIRECSVKDDLWDPSSFRMPMLTSAAVDSLLRAPMSEERGMEVRSTGTVRVHVVTRYILGGFEGK